MPNLITDIGQLYLQALKQTSRSFRRGWITIVAVIGFGGLFLLAVQIAGPLGIAGGFILGAVNALFVGATLSLIEQSIAHARTLTVQDVFESLGQYFWDVIGVGFVLWLPLMALDMTVQANPYGPLLSYAVLLLLFLLLNPAPEVIYQTRHDSPIEVLKSCYDFVLEYWIEWFIPWVLVLVPFVLSPTSHVTANDPGWMGDLSGHRSISELDDNILAHATTRSWDSAVSWPPLCISPWFITSPACLC